MSHDTRASWMPVTTTPSLPRLERIQRGCEPPGSVPPPQVTRTAGVAGGRSHIVPLVPNRREIMADKRQIDTEEAHKVGTALGVDWTKVDPEQFRRGLEVELEHGTGDPETNVTNDDLALTGKIAWAHLKEFPDYCARLDRLEAEAAAYWASRG